MGLRGPKGQHPKVAAINSGVKLEPGAGYGNIALAELPAPPDWLEDAAAVNKWYEVGGALLDLRMLTSLDLDALAAYCNAWARWQAAEAALTENGLVMELPRAAGGTYCQQRPEVAIAVSYYKQLKELAAALGITPAARAKLLPPTRVPSGSDGARTGDHLD